MEASVTDTAVVALLVFGAILVVVVGWNARRLFLRKFARAHRLTGLLYLALLLLGIGDLQWPFLPPHRYMHAIALPAVGVVLSLTAAFDFKDAHARVQNVASGTLDADQTVTFEEMLEHSFYQGLNVAQAVYLYALDRLDILDGGAGGAQGASASSSGGDGVGFSATTATSFTLQSRVVPALLFLAVSSPWLWRSRFPVNHFSDNYTVVGRNPWALTSILYRIKKYQYILYKHALFYGLNVTAAVFGSRGLTHQPFFALYWLCLNGSYVMEFFLQTLVKRGYTSQRWLLFMQHLLMLVSTAAALQLLWFHVDPVLALVSVALNFANRGSHMTNTAVLLAAAFAYRFAFAGSGGD